MLNGRYETAYKSMQYSTMGSMENLSVSGGQAGNMSSI